MLRLNGVRLAMQELIDQSVGLEKGVGGVPEWLRDDGLVARVFEQRVLVHERLEHGAVFHRVIPPVDVLTWSLAGEPDEGVDLVSEAFAAFLVLGNQSLSGERAFSCLSCAALSEPHADEGGRRSN